MVEIDDAMRRALLAREGPPSGARELVLAGVRGRIAAGGGADDPEGLDGEGLDGTGLDGTVTHAPTPASTSPAWWAKVVAATAATTGAGLVALRLSVVGVRALQEPTVEPDDRVVERAPEPPAHTDAPISALPEPASTSQPAPAQRRRTSDAPLARPHDDAGLAEELALVAAAERLRSEAPSAALEQLDRHASRFPSGALAPERELLRIEISCALGRVDQAEPLRERFVAAYPNSPLLARARRACRGTEAAPAGDESR
jgi:hypothetical protein